MSMAFTSMSWSTYVFHKQNPNNLNILTTTTLRFIAIIMMQSIGPSNPRSSGVHLIPRSQPRSTPRSTCISTAVHKTVSLTTNADCELAVSIYPTFAYNAAGGGGMGTVTPPTPGSTRQQVSFDASTLAIPPLDYRSTRLFGIPLPPPLKIEIVPKRLDGFVDTVSGETSLSFDAEFCFSVGPLYKVVMLGGGVGCLFVCLL